MVIMVFPAHVLSLLWGRFICILYKFYYIHLSGYQIKDFIGNMNDE